MGVLENAWGAWSDFVTSDTDEEKEYKERTGETAAGERAKAAKSSEHKEKLVSLLATEPQSFLMQNLIELTEMADQGTSKRGLQFSRT